MQTILFHGVVYSPLKQIPFLDLDIVLVQNSKI